LDVGDAKRGILCRCNKQVDLSSDPLHFFHCRSSQGQFIRRREHIRDALHDMICASVRDDDTPYNISLTIEPLVLLLSIPDSLASAPDPPDKENNPDAMDIAAAVDAAEDTHYIEDIPRLYYCARTTDLPLQIAALAVPRTKQPVNVGATLVSASIV
jgi:hypothetical protein